MPATKVTLWDAPHSSYDLIQWKVRFDPWKVLVVCVFCNMTRRMTAEPIMWKFFDRWPDPRVASEADLNEVKELIKDLGLSSRRAKTLINMSKQYLTDDWEDPAELYGIGKYASDAWHIFVKGDWERVEPKDHALVWYHDWLKSNLTSDGQVRSGVEELKECA